jgi:hypothetical protein
MHVQVTAQLLQEAGLWPPGSDGPEGWKLPTPVPEEYWARITSWALDTRESEDLEARRREIYGPGGGSPFGEVGSVMTISALHVHPCCCVIDACS